MDTTGFFTSVLCYYRSHAFCQLKRIKTLMFTIESDSSLSKKELYLALQKQLDALLVDERDLICNLAQFSAFIMQTVETLNWVGFYLARDKELILGPYVGRVACTRIPFGQGVCGTAVNLKQIQRVDDVSTFSGHIACDSETQSELVFPIMVEGDLIGVLDIDSPIKNRFNEEDQDGIARLLESLIKGTSFEWQF